MHAVRKEFVEVSLPAVVHRVPAAPERYGVDILLDQELGQRVIEIAPAFFEAPGLVPVILPVVVVIRPCEGVIMKGQFIAVATERLPMILLHEVQGHDIGDGDVLVRRVSKNIPRHHPPGELHRLAVGIDQLRSEGRVHDSKTVPGRVGIKIGFIRALVSCDIHRFPDRRIGAEDQMHLPLPRHRTKSEEQNDDNSDETHQHGVSL